MSKRRIIGTTEEAIKKEESSLGRNLSPHFRRWLLENNGIDIEDVHIYPIRDERDVRKTWESLSYNFTNGWASWLGNFEDMGLEFTHLLPFADFGTGDYYCFDYSSESIDNEMPIVIWSHETGKTDFRANDFDEFVEKVQSGELQND